MNQLSKRERTLLFVLAVVTIVGGGFSLGLMPLLERNTALQAENSALAVQQDAIRMSLATKASLENQIETQKQGIDDSLNRLADPLVPEEFDLYLNDWFKFLNINVTRLEYGGTEAISPSALSPVLNDVEYDLQAELDAYLGENSESPAASYANYTILRRQIHIEFQGSSSQLERLMTAFHESKERLYVTAVSYEPQEQQGSLTLEVYSVDKADLKGTNSLGQTDPADMGNYKN